MSQMRTHRLEGRKEERIRELGNMARHKQGLTRWRGGGRSASVSLETRHITNEITCWRGGGRSAFVSLDTWHVTEDSPTGGEEEGGERL
jgi:hypothetical protein